MNIAGDIGLVVKYEKLMVGNRPIYCEGDEQEQHRERDRFPRGGDGETLLGGLAHRLWFGDGLVETGWHDLRRLRVRLRAKGYVSYSSLFAISLLTLCFCVFTLTGRHAANRIRGHGVL